MLHYLLNSALAVGNLAEVARQVGNMVEHPNQSQPNPCPRPPVSPCTRIVSYSTEKLLQCNISQIISFMQIGLSDRRHGDGSSLRAADRGRRLQRRPRGHGVRVAGMRFNCVLVPRKRVRIFAFQA